MKNLIITEYIKKESNRLKAGEAPLWFKIKSNNTISYIPTTVYVNPTRWEHTKKFTQKRRDSDELKKREYIDSTIKELNRIENKFIENNVAYTSEMIKNRILLLDSESINKNKTLLDAFDYHKVYFEDLIAKKERKKNSYKKYRSVKTLLEKFLQEKHYMKDYQVQNLDNKFQNAFHTFLTTQPTLTAKNTVSKYIILLRKVVHLITDDGWLKEYPLGDYGMKKEPTKPTYLDSDEINLILNKDYQDEKLNKIRDYCLFQIMTGLAYSDFMELSEEHIRQINDDTVIMKEREKTQVVATILLQPKAVEILNRYKNKPAAIERGKCFPYISNKEYNLFLKLIATGVGIKKNLTTHVSRHSFGCLMVKNNVDAKARQLALGHSRPAQSDLYARMFATQAIEEQKKMNKAFENPSEKQLKQAS